MLPFDLEENRVIPPVLVVSSDTELLTYLQAIHFVMIKVEAGGIEVDTAHGILASCPGSIPVYLDKWEDQRTEPGHEFIGYKIFVFQAHGTS
jgi:hypothetical protein